MTITQLAHVATHHGHGAVVTLAAVIIGAGLLLPRLLAPALKAESGADPAGERGRRSSEDSEASTSSSSDESDVFEEHSALFRVAEVAPHVQQSQVTIPRRRRGRRTVNIFLRTLTPTQPRGVVLLLHGLNGHSGHGSNLWTAAFLANNGFIVRAMDHEGHGRSAANEQSRVFFRDAEAMAADVADILRDSARDFPGLPHFLMGISFGGCLALKATLSLAPEERRRLVSGLVLQCPFVLPAQDSTPGPLVKAAAHALSVLVPHLPIAGANRGRGANPLIQSKVSNLMQKDPLCYKGKLRVGTAMALVAASESLRSRLAEVDVPFLVQHGDADRVVALEGSRQLLRLAKSEDKELKVYEGASHNLMHELPKTLETIRADYTGWLLEQVGGAPPHAALGPAAPAPAAHTAAAAAAAAAVLLRRAISSVPCEALAFAAAALAATRASAAEAPKSSSRPPVVYEGDETRSSSTGSGTGGDLSPSSSSSSLLSAGGSSPSSPTGVAAAEGCQDLQLVWGGDEMAQQQQGPAAVDAAKQQAAGVVARMLEIRRTASGVSAASLLAHAAAVSDERGRARRRV